MELTGSEETPQSGGYLGVQCSDLFCICASGLFLQLLAQIDSQRTLTEVSIPEGQGEFALPGTFLKTFEIIVYAEVLCFAEVLKARLCAFEVLRALYFPNNFLDSPPIVILHYFLPSDAEQ